jgi:hypothetical protein
MTDPASRVPRRTAFMGLVTTLAVGATTLAVGGFALSLYGVNLHRQAWLMKIEIFGPEPIGIFQADERFGWVHTPSAVGRHRLVPDFDVQYHIDASGHRVVPGTPSADAPVVLFLGGSFTFGEGVEDDEAYPAILQRQWPELRIVNTAVNGWGTVQALFALERALNNNDSIALIVYGHISHHRQRNYLRRSWLDLLMASEGRRNPYFEIENNRLIFRGLADPVQQGLPESPELIRREVQVTQTLIEKMAKTSRRRGIPFAVAYLPDGSQGVGLEVVARGAGPANVIDLRPLIDFDAIHFEHDPHPHAEGHREIAAELQRLLEPRLGDVIR